MHCKIQQLNINKSKKKTYLFCNACQTTLLGKLYHKIPKKIHQIKIARLLAEKNAAILIHFKFFCNNPTAILYFSFTYSRKCVTHANA